ncbi:MAG: hypothetical protein ACKOJG_02350, partial [Actinomycetota bacterium]
MGIVVICSYRPKAGGAQALDALIAQHVPTLKRLDLVTDRPAVHATAADGTRVEVFEWKSEDAS